MQWQIHRFAFVKPAIYFCRKIWIIFRVCICWQEVILTVIIICSFNNNALKKCANGKAFYIVATESAQFFATLLQERLVVLGCCLLVVVTKIHDKFASLLQVNSPNSQDKFQICCTNMCLVRFLVNSAAFCGFTWNSQLRDRAKYQKPWHYPVDSECLQ